MRAIVTTDAQIKEKEYKDYIIVDSIKELFSKPDIKEIILHSAIESPFQTSLQINELNKLRDNLRVVYINEEPNSMLRITINGLGGIHVDSMLYFESVDDLNMLFKDFTIMETPEDIIKGNINILQSFIEEYARTNGDVSIFYITKAKRALTQLREDTDSQTRQVKAIGNTALEVLGSANEYLLQMQDQYKKLEQQMVALEQSANTPRNNFGGGSSSAGVFYPTVKLNTSALAMTKVLFIREYSHCRYLTSLLIAYRYYLQYCKNKRVKLVFAVQRGQGTANKYDFTTMITLESMREMSLYANPILAVNVPQKSVIDKIFGRDGGNNDIIIFVDRLYAGSDIISADSTNFKRLCAISGSSDIKRYNLRAQNCILTYTGLEGKEFCCIPHFTRYPQSEDRRLSSYQQLCTDASKSGIYLKFDKLLGV